MIHTLLTMICLLIISFLPIILSQCGLNNVCGSFEAYRSLRTNPECWHDPDIGVDAKQIARNNGFELDYRQVATEDGYILTILHILNRTDGPPILLNHGLLVDGTIFMLLKNESLAFYLSNQGYDVWLANFRGCRYSPKHIKYTTFDKEYWDFSFHEMGYYDMPAIVDLITNNNRNKRKVTVIGHSMGTTVSFVYAATRLEHAGKNIEAIIALAPVAYVANTPVSQFVAQNYDLLYSFLSPFASYGIGSNLKLLRDFIQNICSTYPVFLLCASVFEQGGGYNRDEIRPEILPLRFSLTLSGISIKTLIHYGQLIRNQNFTNYDYGRIENLKRYVSIEPPNYDLEKINVPVHLFYGKKDLLADEKDVLHLYSRLQTTKSIQSVLNDGTIEYAHEDFIVGKSAIKFYNELLQKL